MSHICIVYKCKREVHEYTCLLCDKHCEHEAARRAPWWKRVLRAMVSIFE